jgi:anti-sigma regulatory factor (Ser/Thr protein kinase)
MANQSLRIILYSSIAIALLALVWGLRQIPTAGRLAEEAVRASVDQESIVLNGAVRASTEALKYRLLDVLKAEGTDRTSRTFQNSPFLAATLLEWDQVQWKTLWYSVKSKTDMQAGDFAAAMKDWPLHKLSIDEAFFAKVADIQGQAYFAIAVPVRRPNQAEMVGVGIFPAAQFGLSMAADQNREVRVFDPQGAALVLSHPAYLGTSLKSEALVREALATDEALLHHEWSDENGQARVGVSARVPGSNLQVAVETTLRPPGAWRLQSWFYLILCVLGAAALNWYLFSSLLKPLLKQLSQSDEVQESLRRQLQDSGALVGTPRPTAVVLAPEPVIPHSALPHLNFQEPAPSLDEEENEMTGELSAAPATLGKIVYASLRSLDPKIREHAIQVMHFGLDELEMKGDALQLQTAIEEVLKNSIEAMAAGTVRNLTISGRRRDNRIVLTVEDSGCGIAESDVEKVFDPFFSTKDTEGVSRGLGLNVVRRVIEELGGSVKLSSHRSLEESGTRVEMEWPAAGVSRSVRVGQSESVPPIPSPAADASRPEPEEIDIDDLTEEIMNVPLRPSRPFARDVMRKPKVVRNLD